MHVLRLIEWQKACYNTSILALLGGLRLLRQAGVQPCGRLRIVTAEHKGQPVSINSLDALETAAVARVANNRMRRGRKTAAFSCGFMLSCALVTGFIGNTLNPPVSIQLLFYHARG